MTDLLARLAQARAALKSIERWAVQHAAKPQNSAAAVLSMIRYHQAIRAITKRYEDAARATDSAGGR